MSPATARDRGTCAVRRSVVGRDQDGGVTPGATATSRDHPESSPGARWRGAGVVRGALARRVASALAMKQAAPSEVVQFAAARSVIEPVLGTTWPAIAARPKR